MPFCTNCGHDNPEGSNFCGQCGSALTPLRPRSEPARDGDRMPSGDTTKTIPAMVEERDTESLTAEEEAAVSALPQGSALLIVQRGRERRQPLPAQHRSGHRRPAPGLRHLPRRHLGVPPARHLHPDARGHAGQGPGQPERHLREPRPGRRVPAATRRRGPDRQVPAGLLRQPARGRVAPGRRAPWQTRDSRPRGTTAASARCWRRCATSSPTSPSPRSGSWSPRG